MSVEPGQSGSGKGQDDGDGKGNTMSDIDDVLERLVTDAAFRDALADDPATALAGYSLEEGDLEVLAATLDDDGASEHGVEQRTSKSAILGLIVGLAGGGGGSSPKANGAVSASWDQLAVSRYIPGDTPSSGAPADLAEGGGTAGAGGSGEGAKGPSEVRDLPGNEADSADSAGRVKVQFHWDASTGDPDTRSLAEDDRPGDLRTPEEDVEPALNAFARLTANGTSVGEAPIDDLADEEPARAEGTTSDDEVMYVPVRRSAGSGADDLAELNSSTEVEGNEVPIEPVVIQNEGFDPTSGEPTIEVVGGIDVSSDVVEGDGDPEAPEAQGEPTRD